MIALKCDRDIQASRLKEKGGRTDAEIRARLKNQQHIEKSFYKADTVVDTGVELAEMFARILSVTEGVMGDDGSDREV